MAIDLVILISLSIIGFFIGILAAMVGIGGGALMVPVLIFFYGLTTTQASATSSLVIVFTASSGAFTYWRQKRIDIRSGLFLMVVAIPFAFIGAFLAESIDENFLTVIFGAFLIMLSIQRLTMKTKTKIHPNPSTLESNDNPALDNPISIMENPKRFLPRAIEDRTLIDDKNEEFRYQVKIFRIMFLGFTGGLLGGLLGVGGGVIFVPVLTEIGGLPPHIAIATSTFVVLFNALSSSLGRVLFGESIVYDFVLPLAIGTVSGARLGASRVRKLSAQRILRIFYLIVLFVGVRAILRGLGLF
jgi:uncharacterized membrane protein YfcA